MKPYQNKNFQVKDYPSFVKNLKILKIPYQIDVKPVDDIKPTQKYINYDIVGNYKDKKDISPIVVSNDHKIIDGHHRYLSKVFGNQPTIMCIIVSIPFDDCEEKLIEPFNQLENMRKMKKINKHTQNMATGMVDNEVTYGQEVDPEYEETNHRLYHRDLGDKLYQNSKVLYRKTEPVPDSPTGNFYYPFSFEDGQQYEIEYDQFYMMDEFNKEKPYLPFIKKYYTPQEVKDYINSCSETNLDAVMYHLALKRAKEMNYDGINYCNKFIQV